MPNYEKITKYYKNIKILQKYQNNTKISKISKILQKYKISQKRLQNITKYHSYVSISL